MYIKTERLVLKPYTDDDRVRMIQMLTDEKIKETYMIPDFKSEEEALKLFFRLKNDSLSDKCLEAGIYLNCMLIGFVNEVDKDGDRIELGYVIDPEYNNRGYATEALKGVMDELFRSGVKEIVTGAFESNIASIKVMQKCGMKLTQKVEDIEYHGMVHHCVYYSKKVGEN